MKFLIIAAVFFISIFLISCGTTNGVTGSEKISLDSWIGLSRAELIKTWGRPTKENPDGHGGEIITYDSSMVYGQAPGAIYNNGNRGVNNSVVDNYVVTKSRMFYINPSAIIYRWSAKERRGY